MAFRSLSEVQKRIIAASLLRADTSAKSIAREIKVAEPTVRRNLELMREHGVLRPFLLVNVHALGYTDFCMAVSLYNETPKHRKMFIEYARRHDRVAWLAELSGEYHFSISIFAKNEVEALNFFQDLADRAPDINLKKYFSIRTSWNMISPPKPGATSNNRDELSRTPTKLSAKFDELDHRILFSLNKEPLSTDIAISRLLKTPIATIQYRINRLKNEGLLGGVAYYFEPHAAGQFGYRLFIQVPNNSRGFSKKLLEFSRKTSAVSAFVECLGNWDYELNCEVGHPSEATRLREQLLELFPTQISHIQLLQIIETLKIEPYPLNLLSNH